MIRVLEYKITEADAGRTVERFLRSRGYSRALLTQLKMQADGLTVDDTRVFTVHRLAEGTCLRIFMRETEESETITPVPLPLDTIYEDADIFVINKPADMAVHPSQGNRESALANAVAWLYRERGEPFVFRAIGRLDKNTSGLVLLAKHALSACILSEHGRARREYCAICEGVLPEHGTIDAPIGRADGSAILRCVRADGARAVTHFTRLSQQNGLSYARVWLDTGRTHQIRVHMAHIGCPLVGDFLYNPCSTHIARHALHATTLHVLHPITGEQLSFTAPLPDDMASLLQK